MLNENLESMEVEPFYIEPLWLQLNAKFVTLHTFYMRVTWASPFRMAEKKNTSTYVELPLEELKKMFTSEVERKFLEEQIVASHDLKSPCSPVFVEVSSSVPICLAASLAKNRKALLIPRTWVRLITEESPY